MLIKEKFPKIVEILDKIKKGEIKYELIIGGPGHTKKIAGNWSSDDLAEIIRNLKKDKHTNWNNIAKLSDVDIQKYFSTNRVTAQAQAQAEATQAAQVQAQAQAAQAAQAEAEAAQAKAEAEAAAEAAERAKAESQAQAAAAEAEAAAAAAEAAAANYYQEVQILKDNQEQSEGQFHLDQIHLDQIHLDQSSRESSEGQSEVQSDESDKLERT